ncbi:hypothetical protein FI667_g8776, partial [Globisporangium splendens]
MHSGTVAHRVLRLLEQKKALSMIVSRDRSVLLSSYHRYTSPKWMAKHQELLHKRSLQQCASTRRQLNNSSRKQQPLGALLHILSPTSSRATTSWFHPALALAAAIVFAIRVEQAGNDFTFRFEWLKDRRGSID